jgi:hypothetical protein
MKEFLKSIGFFVLGVVLLAALMTLVGLFLYGAGWLSEKVLPVVSLVGAVTLLILLLVFLPLSIFRKCRGWCAAAFIYWSYLCGLSLWMTSLLVTLNLWGLTAAIIGLLFMGVGILPVALLACIFKGEWSIFFQLILQLVFLIGCRLFGFYLAHKAEQEELCDAKEKRERSKQFMKPWLRWILVFPAAIGAGIGIQIGIILVSGIVDITWFGGLGGAHDAHLFQFLNTIACVWAFVFAGAKTAPSNRGATALCLTALFILGAFGVIYLAQDIESAKGFWGTEWSLICLGVSAVTMAIMCYEICKEEKHAAGVAVCDAFSAASDAYDAADDAINSFKVGKEIWLATVKVKSSRESELTKIMEAVKYFDRAIEKGFDDSEVFSLRGSCLNDLGFYFDALEDYDSAIERNPQKGIAQNYFERSIIKDSLMDFEGSQADLKEAIRLSKLDNDDNAFWNEYARSTGFASATTYLEMNLETEEGIAFKKRRYPENTIAEKLKTIKRRKTDS